jgi:hypothetical protein
MLLLLVLLFVLAFRRGVFGTRSRRLLLSFYDSCDRPARLLAASAALISDLLSLFLLSPTPMHPS